MNAYLSQLQSILDHGTEKSDRTGVGTISLFGLQSRYDLAEGFPAVTTKKLVWKSMVSELLWFVSGSGNINDLKSIYKSNKLWDLNYQDFLKRHELDTSDGDMGRVYGRQWRHWLSPQGETIDQLTDAIDLIRHNPDSRRIIVNAWNPAEIGTLDVALPPCHAFFQFYVANGRLSCQLYQRSADIFLGVPFNIASYALLTMMIAQVCGLRVGEFVHTLGDAHIYLNHEEQVTQQLSREPKTLPIMTLNKSIDNIFDFTFDDFSLEGYDPEPLIKAPVAV